MEFNCSPAELFSPSCSSWLAATNHKCLFYNVTSTHHFASRKSSFRLIWILCRSAYFWQYPVLSDQENTGAAFSSQKALGVFSWWNAEWLFRGRSNGGWKSAAPNRVVPTLHSPAGGWRLGQLPQILWKGIWCKSPDISLRSFLSHGDLAH